MAQYSTERVFKFLEFFLIRVGFFRYGWGFSGTGRVFSDRGMVFSCMGGWIFMVRWGFSGTDVVFSGTGGVFPIRVSHMLLFMKYTKVLKISWDRIFVLSPPTGVSVGGTFLWRSKSTFSWFAHRLIGWEFLSFNSQKWSRLKNEKSSSDPGPRVLGTVMKPNHMNQG